MKQGQMIISKTQILENVFDLERDFVDENTIAVNIIRPSTPIQMKIPLIHRENMRNPSISA